MEFVTDYSLFLAKSITVVLAILAITGASSRSPVETGLWANSVLKSNT